MRRDLDIGRLARRSTKFQHLLFATLLKRKHLFWIFKFAQVLAKFVRFLRPGGPQVVISETHFRHALHTKHALLINDQLANHSTKQMSIEGSQPRRRRSEDLGSPRRAIFIMQMPLTAATF